MKKSKVAAEETQTALQETYSTVTKGAADFNLQWIEMVRANMNSTLDFARQLVGTTRCCSPRRLAAWASGRGLCPVISSQPRTSGARRVPDLLTVEVSVRPQQKI